MDPNTQPPIGLQYPERLDPYTRAELEQIIAALNRRLHNVTESIPSGIVAQAQPIFFGISGREGERGRDGVPGATIAAPTSSASSSSGQGVPGRDGKDARTLMIIGGASSASTRPDYVVMSNGANPPSPMDDGAGNFIYVAYTP